MPLYLAPLVAMLPQKLLPLLLLLPLMCCPSVLSSDLYEPSEHLTVLSFSELKSVVYSGSPRVHWLVHVYNRYCGHCINFAPAFKLFAKSVKDWPHTVRIGLIDSAEPGNRRVFSHFSIRGVPSLLFVSNVTSWRARSSAELRANAENLAAQLLDLLLPFVPQLAPLRPHETPNCDFLLEERAPGYLSRHVTMDHLRHLRLRWRPNAAVDLGVRVSRVSDGTVLGTARSLTDLRRLLAIPTAAPATEAASSLPPSPPALGKLHPPTLRDLRSAVVRSLAADVPGVGLDTPEVWPATVEFVQLLDAHLSSHSAELAALLRPLSAALPSSAPSGAEWRRVLSGAGFPDRPPDDWVTCRGSRDFLRGYPCSVWQLFHTLTAVRFVTGSGPPVLPVMRRYLVATFSCRNCAANLKRGSANLTAELGSATNPAPGTELLWLWRKHNLVNGFLSGSHSEDPAFPKKFFPPPDLCRACSSGPDTSPEVAAAAASFLSGWYGPRGAGWASHPDGNYLTSPIVETETAETRLHPVFKLALGALKLCASLFVLLSDALF